MKKLKFINTKLNDLKYEIQQDNLEERFTN